MSNVSKKPSNEIAANVARILKSGELDAASLRAAEEILTEGTPANTVRSYASALRYWSAWYALRYACPLPDAAVSVAVVSQFILDHLERLSRDGLKFELPPAVDAQLVALGAKARPGPLAHSTVGHRMAVLSKWHRLRGFESPCDDHRVKTLMAKARRGQAKRGVGVRKKTAAVAEPLQAMLATCTDGLRGLRDRALLLLAWSGGGRRRSEVVNVNIEDLRRIDDQLWTYSIGATKTDASGVRREKPLRGEAVRALSEWMAASGLREGALFPRLQRGNRVGKHRLTGDQVARIVQRRAGLAQLRGDWGAHSLRSGFVTEAGRQGVPLGEVMAMTEHRSVGTVMGYFQAGTLLSSRATNLLGAAEGALDPSDSTGSPLPSLPANEPRHDRKDA
jgi:integrase